MASLFESIKSTATQAIYGKETTQDHATDASAKVNAAANAAGDKSKDLASQARDAASDTANHAANAVETYAGVAKDKKDEGAEQLTSAFDQLQVDVTKKSNEAIAEGKKDVKDAQAQSQSYLEQAKGLTSDALSTAQEYVAAGEKKLSSTTTTAPGKTNDAEETNAGPTSGITATLSQAGAAALSTTGSLLESARGALQPSSNGTTTSDVRSSVNAKVEEGKDAARQTTNDLSAQAKSYAEAGKEAAAPYVDQASRTAQPYLEKAKGANEDAQKKAQEHINGAKNESGGDDIKTAPTSFGTGLF